MLRNYRYSQEAHFMPASYPSTRNGEARQSQERAYEQRPQIDKWKPPQAMGVPTDENFEYRWVREYVQGQMDPANVTKSLNEGYITVHIEDLPPGFLVDPDLHGDGYARHGGLLLMRIPKELARQREEHYRRKRQMAVQGANELQGVAQRANRPGDVAPYNQSRQIVEV